MGLDYRCKIGAMSEVPKTKPGVRLEVETTDPRYVRAYRAASRMEDAFAKTVRALGDLPLSDRTSESLRRLSLYLGTLATEAIAASIQLSLLEMPRAQYILNRQIFEYFARNRWFLEHKSAALMEMDLLPKTAYLEVRNNKGAFKDPAFVQQYEATYLAWAAQNPALDSAKHAVPGPTEMVRLSLDQPDDLFWYYGYPSIIVHGKTHGIQEVLKREPDGTLSRSENSLGLEPVREMYRTTAFCLQYGMLLAVNFPLAVAPDLKAAQQAFDDAMVSDGFVPQTLEVKKYP